MTEDASLNPHVKFLVLLSGKRMSGKDYVGEHLAAVLERELQMSVLFLHAPLEMKRSFAAKHGLDVDKLTADRGYKELHRQSMTTYMEEVLGAHGDTYFCELLRWNYMEKAKRPTLCLMDIRYQFELDYYRKLSPFLIAIRLSTSDDVRTVRGWKVASIDEHPSETDLDNTEDWDYFFSNSEDGPSLLEEFSLQVSSRLRAQIQ